MKNKTIGIYLITERETGKMYVGLSKRRDGIEGRWVKHKSRFPEALFSYEILLPCPPETTREELSNLEKFYIRELDCMEPNGFNKTSGGTRGSEVSEETRKRQSTALKGRVKGPMSAEHRAKRSAAMKGKNKGRVPPNKGVPMSAETRAKCSAANKGRVQSAETRAKRSAANKGKVPSNKGKPKSEEQKMKLSESAKARAALKRAAKAAAEAALEALLFAETETILSLERIPPSL